MSRRMPRNRRGSTLFMVAMMLMALMAVTAIALDIGRYYVVTNEMHSATDASALAGAARLQHSTITNDAALVEDVQDHVMAYVSAHYKVDNATYTLLRDSIRLAYLDSAHKEPRFDYAAMNRKPNAVVVRGRVEPAGVFSAVMGHSNPEIWRRSVAWIANLNSSNCVKPWALPYTPLYNLVMGTSLPATSIAPDLQQAKLAAFNDLPEAQRRLTYRGDNQDEIAGRPTDGEWNGFLFSGNSGMAWYSTGIGTPDCTGSSYGLSTVDEGSYMPSQGPNNNDVSCKSVWINRKNPVSAYGCGNTGPGAGGTGICWQKSLTDAGCYPSEAAAAASDVGREMFVSFGDKIGGGTSYDVRLVGRVTLLCYYVSTSASCPAPAEGRFAVGYGNGTMVIQLNGLGVREITPETVISDVISIDQRLLLVK